MKIDAIGILELNRDKKLKGRHSKAASLLIKLAEQPEDLKSLINAPIEGREDISNINISRGYLLPSLKELIARI